MPSESELEIELLSITPSKKFSFSSGGNRHDFIFPSAEGVYKNCISDTRRLRNFCPAKLGDLLFLICAIFSKGEDMKEYAIKNGNHNWRWRTIDIPASYVFKRSIPSPTLIPDFMREECLKLFHS